MDANLISKEVVDASVKVHQALGPGLLESVYETVLCKELTKRGLSIQQQEPISIHYDGECIQDAFRADVIVNELVVLELKSVELLSKLHRKQLFTYLKLSKKSLGLLLNFGAPLMKDGIVRVVNNLPE